MLKQDKILEASSAHISSVEVSIIDYIQSHLQCIFLIFITIVGVAIRIPLRHHISGDAQYCLLPWYREILEFGIARQVGNYNLPYQFCIYLFTKLPIKPLYAYKALSCFFDFILAIVCGAIVYELTKKHTRGLMAYSCILISPVVILNSAAWAQCDSIFVAFAMLGIYMLLKDKVAIAMLSFGFSLAFKLQAVFFFPALIILYLLKRYSVLHTLLIPLTLFAVSLPMTLSGRNLMEVVAIYVNQTHTYPNMVMNYPSFYSVLTANNYAMYSKMAILLTIAILGIQLFYIMYKRIEITKESMINLFFVTVYTCVLFLPSMHERYGYPYEILACILAIVKPKTILLCIGLNLITLRTYSAYLFGARVDLTLLAFLNIIIYCVYIYILLKNPHTMGTRFRNDKVS